VEDVAYSVVVVVDKFWACCDEEGCGEEGDKGHSVKGETHVGGAFNETGRCCLRNFLMKVSGWKVMKNLEWVPATIYTCVVLDRVTAMHTVWIALRRMLSRTQGEPERKSKIGIYR